MHSKIAKREIRWFLGLPVAVELNISAVPIHGLLHAVMDDYCRVGGMKIYYADIYEVN